jgi:two-component system LytT family response regulator
MSTFLHNLSNPPSELVDKLNTYIRVLVAEPDTVSRRLICATLETEPDVSFQCINNSDIVAAIQDSAPDLVIVDLQATAMGRTDNWEALGVKSPPATIVTSYARTSLIPFASEIADLLMKPFNVEQFEHAMESARAKIEDSRARSNAKAEYNRSDDRLSAPRKFLQRFAAESEGRIVLIKVHDVLWLQSFGNYIRVHSAGTLHLVRNTMRNVQSLLDPSIFLRIHRNAIVNLDHVLEFFLPATGNMFVRLDNGLSLPLRRSSRALLRKFLKQHPLL